jgi:prolyl oligopeptidase
LCLRCFLFAEYVEQFHKGYGPDKWIGESVSEDGKYLPFVVSHGWSSNEVYVQTLSGGPIQTMVNDIPAHFLAWFAGDRLVMQTDWLAPNQRIVVIDLNSPAPEKWRTIVPEGPDAIAGFSLVGGKLFVSYLHNVTTQIKVFNLDGKALGEVSLPGIGSASGLAGRSDSNEALFSFRLFVTAQTIYGYDVQTGKPELWARHI